MNDEVPIVLVAARDVDALQLALRGEWQAYARGSHDGADAALFLSRLLLKSLQSLRRPSASRGPPPRAALCENRTSLEATPAVSHTRRPRTVLP